MLCGSVLITSVNQLLLKEITHCIAFEFKYIHATAVSPESLSRVNSLTTKRIA